MAENAGRDDTQDTSIGADDARPELAAMIGPLLRSLTGAEKGVLDAHRLTMCGYAVLLHLGAAPSAMTRTALTEAVGAGRTRVIAVLYELENRGSVRSEPGSAEELLTLTPGGRRLRDVVRSSIRSEEERLLDRLPSGDREAFVRALRTLSAPAVPR